MAAVCRVYRSYGGNGTHDRVLTAFATGCPDSVQLCAYDAYEPSPIAVIFGVGKKMIDFTKWRGAVLREQRARGLTTVVLESGYVRRGDGPDDYYAVGLDGINGWADFKNWRSPPDRWNQLGVPLKPWRTKSDSQAILLVGQVPWDASVQDIDFPRWLVRTAKQLRERTKRRIWYRPHPAAPAWALPAELKGCKTVQGDLATELSQAYCVVTWNSNVGVDALIAGVPVFGLGRGHMYGDLAVPSLKGYARPWTKDRVQWAANLAYTQWTPAEIAQGKAWRHLFTSRGPRQDQDAEEWRSSLLTSAGAPWIK